MTTYLQPSEFKAYLSVALTAGGNETTISIDRMTTLSGETVSSANFSLFGRGVITVNPDGDGVSSTPEFISFTTVNGLTLTGATRNLSAMANTQLSTPSQYFPTGTPVIISWGFHQISDLVTYIGNVLAGGSSNASTTVAGNQFASEVATTGKVRSLNCLVAQLTSPNMTLNVAPFTLSDQNFDVTYAGGVTSTYTAPVSNPRIDLLCYNVYTSVLSYRTGTESASPTKPTPTSGDIVLCSIYHRVGETKILDTNDNVNGYIYSWYYPSVYEGSVYPGTYFSYGGLTAPAGYLICDGSAISRTTYATLFAAIGTNFGAGNGTTTFNLPVGGLAISRDTNATGNIGSSTTLSFAHTCSGKQMILLVYINYSLSGGGDDIVSVTYGGTSMIQCKKLNFMSTDNSYHYIYGLINPPAGTANIVATFGPTAQSITAYSSSYSGADQTQGLPDASASNSATSGTSLTTSVSTVGNLTWIFGGAEAATSVSAGVQLNLIAQAGGIGILDTNSNIIPAGTTTVGINGGSSGHMALIAVSFKGNAGTTIIKT